MNRTIPVLVYHSVSDADPRNPFSISPGLFAEHRDAIVQSGRTPLTITEVADAIRGHRQLPERSVALTFDDGYDDSLAAIAAAAEEGITSTLYVTTGLVAHAGGLPRADLMELARMSEVELGAHTISHPRLDELKPAAARKEIAGSREALQELVQGEVRSFAYPHGSFDPKVRSMVIEAGYTSAVAVKNAVSHPGDDPWSIARWTVLRTTPAAEIAGLLAGTRGRLAWPNDRLRTRAYRYARRLHRRVVPRQPAPALTLALAPAPSIFQGVTAPVAVRQLDLAGPVPDISLGSARTGEPYRSLALFLRTGPEVEGWLTLDAPPSGQLTSAALREALAASPFKFDSRRAGRSRPADPVAVEIAEAMVSVIVPTCADAAAVVKCVQTIKDRARGPYEIVVVENRPERSAVRRALQETFGLGGNVHYVEEPARGLSNARNAGLLASRGELVAFIDDDIVVDEHWMGSVRDAFAANPSARCVTGLILPLELETSAQLTLERFAGFSKGYHGRSFSADDPPTDVPMFPYTAGHFGSGANTTFRREALIAMDGFDRQLGTGTSARGAEDLDAYIRLIVEGGTLVYEPRAVVWHRHPDTERDLHQRAFSYGVGLGALVGKLLFTSKDRRTLLSLTPTALVYLMSPGSRKNAGRDATFPRRLKLLELAGLAFGPFAYLAGQRGRQPDGQSSPALPAPARAPAPATERRIWSGQLELTDPTLPSLPLTASDGGYFHAARFLIRVVGTPVGFVELDAPEGRVTLEQILELAASTLGVAISRELESCGAGPWDGKSIVEGDFTGGPVWMAGDRGTVTAVVCTRNRPEGARRCLESLQALRYPDLELLVVDNAPDDDATEVMVRSLSNDDPRIRYVREERPGLSRARNRGLAVARGDFLAFTDDDVRVDPLWIDGVLRGFARDENVACVTGLVASASLEHPAEQYFDGRVWWSSNCEHRLHAMEPDEDDSPLHPYAAGTFGTGANVSFRTEALRQVGGFDECLGAGSPTAGGEDLDIFVRMIRAGHTLSYEPAALVWHEHRVDEASLQRQMYGYGKGLSAYLVKYLSSSQTAPEVLRRLAAGLFHAGLLAMRSARTRQSAGVSSSLLRAEATGLLAGPRAYYRARRQQDPAHLAKVAP